MSENIIKTIETSLESVEKQIEVGEKVSLKEVKKLETRINNLANVYNLSADDLSKYQSRIDNIRQRIQSDKKSFILIPAASKEGIWSAIKKHPLGTGLVIAGAAVILTGCGVAIANGATDKQVIEESDTSKDVEPTIENETMNAEYKEMADEIIASMNDSISKGLVVNEENKEVMTKKYVLYYMLNKMDTLTDEQWANIFQNSTITAKDIMDAKYEIEYFGEQAIIASETGLNYSYMFEENDSKLLTDAKALYDIAKNSKGNEKIEATKAFENYINENLVLNEGKINYSQRALDTFRKIYFDAFDTITGGKIIDDELEHHVNTIVTCSIAENDLNVEDETIDSLQSKYTTYLEEKLTIRLQNGWSYVMLKGVNPNNDINKIVEYVENNIDLSLYNEMPDYRTTLREILSEDEKKSSKDDSGVSDGKDGNVSKNDMIEHGVDPTEDNAKEKYEESVKEETKKKEEESVTVEDNSGEVVEDKEQLKYYAKLGATDYNAGTYDESKVPGQYLNAYRQGMNEAKKAIEEAQKEYQNKEETSYEEVSPTTTEEVEIETYNYTTEVEETKEEQDTEASNDNVTEFVPIEEFESIEDSETIIEELETETYDYVEVSSRINELEQLKQELLAATIEFSEEENIKTI